MKLIEEVEVQLDFADLLNRQPLDRRDKGLSRAPGINLSGVLRHTLASSRMPGWQKYEKEIETEDLLLGPKQYLLIWFLGVCWEEGVASLYPDWMWQPGESSIQTPAGPVWMNCDGLNGSLCCVEEAKYTSCKRRTWAEFSLDWLKMQQGAGYCNGYGPELVRWHVLYNNQPWAPVYVRYLVEFSRKDLEGSRRMIEANRQGAIGAGYGE